MPVAVRSIETAVPSTVLEQGRVRDLFGSQPGLTRLGQRINGAAFDASAIETRHTVIAELAAVDPANGQATDLAVDPAAEPASGTEPPTFYDASSGRILTPGTGARNDVYIERSVPLLLDAARRALAAASDLTAADVTHVVTVSCTGFSAPGPDYRIVRDLGLSPATKRYHVGFMGCYGAFPALGMARDFCRADPSSVVLIVCIELCTLHLRSSSDPDAIVASSVFADGAAAAIVTSRPAPPGVVTLDIDALETTLTPVGVGEADMAWTIGDQGFDMVLSSYVPHIVEHHIDDALAPVFATEPALAVTSRAEAIEHWAIHPGGRSILDRVQQRVDLSDEQLAPSRDVLRRYGNMSSGTVLFVLREILHGSDVGAGERVCAVAFGPGLTVETGLFTLRGAPVAGAPALVGASATPRAEVPADPEEAR